MSIARFVVGAALLSSVAAGSASAAPTPQQLLDQMAAQFARVNDYEVTIDSTSRDKGKENTIRYRFAYKKPRMIRLRTLSGENKDGELVVRPDGVIRGRKSAGLVKVFAVTMSRDDKRLCDSEGVGVWEMDHGSLIQRLKCKAQASTNQASVSASGSDYILEIRYNSGALAGATDRYWVDSKSLFMERYERTKSGITLERDVYSDLRINPGFTPAYFEF